MPQSSNGSAPDLLEHDVSALGFVIIAKISNWFICNFFRTLINTTPLKMGIKLILSTFYVTNFTFYINLFLKTLIYDLWEAWSYLRRTIVFAAYRRKNVIDRIRICTRILPHQAPTRCRSSQAHLRSTTLSLKTSFLNRKQLSFCSPIFHQWIKNKHIFFIQVTIIKNCS